MPDSLQPGPHYQRWRTGLLLGLPVAACVTVGPSWSWWLILTVMSALATWELHGLFFTGILPLKWRALSFTAAVLMPAGAHFLGLTGLNLALFCSVFGAFCLILLTSPRDPEEISRVARLALAWFYVPFLVSYMLLVGAAPQGRFCILFVLGTIVAGDAGAYHTGVKFGRHKLFEQVSPKKTIEGAAGGLAASMVVGTILGSLFLKNLQFSEVLAFSFFVAITGQIGDLVESMIKRNCGKKDSSGLLPGHGGLLDRLDSLVFAFPLMWFLLRWVA